MAGWLTRSDNLRPNDRHLYQLRLSEDAHSWIVLLGAQYQAAYEQTATALLEICVKAHSREQFAHVVQYLKERIVADQSAAVAHFRDDDECPLYQLAITQRSHTWLVATARKYGVSHQMMAIALLEICADVPTRAQVCKLVDELTKANRDA